MTILEVLVPLLNANEPEARVVMVHQPDGASVEKGVLLFTIETTKATADIESPGSGFFHPLVSVGDSVLVGARLAILSSSKDEIHPSVRNQKKEFHRRDESLWEGMRITKPAIKLANSLGLKPEVFPAGVLITEEKVREISQRGQFPVLVIPPSTKKRLIIFGGGGHAKTVIDAINLIGEYSIAGIVDDNTSLTGGNISGVPILGTRDCLAAIREKGINDAINCVGGILDINVRVGIYDLLEQNGFSFPVLVHPRATVEPSAKVKDGAQLLAHCYIGSEATLCPRVLINTSAVISHDCVIGEYSHIAPGALLAGHVRIGARTLVGMGVTTAIGVCIGEGVRIGNGAKILADVPDHTIIQAGSLWTGKAH